MTPEDFQAATHVSRETLERLKRYETLLRDWQQRLNLVGPRSLDTVWNRHFFDSAQLLPLFPDGAKIHIDLGSGAGFPGLVLAIMGDTRTHLVESNQRKAAFLKAVVQATDAPVDIHAVRAESLTKLKGDVVTARALAPMEKLLPLVRPFCREGSVAVLSKGQHVEDELTKTAIPANIHIDRITSRSDPRGTILRVSGWA